MFPPSRLMARDSPILSSLCFLLQNPPVPLSSSFLFLLSSLSFRDSFLQESIVNWTINRKSRFDRIRKASFDRVKVTRSVSMRKRREDEEKRQRIALDFLLLFSSSFLLCPFFSSRNRDRSLIGRLIRNRDSIEFERLRSIV